MPSTIEVTPQERLAITRKAIIRHMNRDNRLASSDDSPELDKPQFARRGVFGAWDSARHALLVWWHRHPASSAVELAKPLMSEYAQSHPFILLGVSAAAGAVIVLMKPWKMMSPGSLLVTALKSTGFSSGILSLLSRPRQSYALKYSSGK